MSKFMQSGVCVNFNEIGGMSKKFKDLKSEGFDNCQLISWKPELWTDKNLEIIKNLDVSHISYYSLIIEEKTAFYKLREEGKIKEVGDTLFVKMDNEISNTLKDFGFTRYEISNYSKFRFESKHNLAYWESKDFLGLGASAYSGYLKYNNNMLPVLVLCCKPF